MDIQKSNYGYPKFKIIFGYPKIHLRISIIHRDFWISKNVFSDIHNSIKDIHNSFKDIHNSFMDIHNSFMDKINSKTAPHIYDGLCMRGSQGELIEWSVHAYRMVYACLYDDMFRSHFQT